MAAIASARSTKKQSLKVESLDSVLLPLKGSLDIPKDVFCQINSDENSSVNNDIHIYVDPHTLPCLHSFCKECLKKEIETSESSKEFKCPTCSIVSTLPDNGVDGLPRDLRLEFRAQSMEFIIKLAKPESIQCDNCESKIPKEQTASFCCDCRQFLCKRCADFHLISKLTKKHTLVNTADKNAKEDILKNIKPPELRYCMVPRHNMQSLALDFYCLTCEELVCHSCLLASHRDENHEYMSLRDVAKKHVEEMQACLDQAEDASCQLKDAKQRSEKMISQVKTAKKQVRSKIEKEFKKIEEKLNVRKNKLLEDTEKIATDKLTCLNIQQEEFVKLQKRIQDYMDAIKMTVTYQDEEVVAFKRMLQTELDKLLQEFGRLSLRLNESEAIPTSLDPSAVTGQIETYGKISAGSSPEKAKVYLHMSRAVQGKPRKFVVRVFDEDGKPFEYGGEDIKGELKLPGSEDIVEGLGEYKGKGVYEVSLIPKQVGMNELVVTVRNRPVQGSPFLMLVREAKNWKDLPDKVSDCVQSNVLGNTNIYGLAMHASGMMFVSTDSYIRVVDLADNTCKKTVGNGRGSGEQNFYYPEAIAISGDKLYISDSNNHRIQVIQAVGEYQFERKPFSGSGSGDGRLNQPRGICVDNGDKIYVADRDNHRIVVFENDGTFSRNIKPECGKIRKPWGIAFDPLGNLHVVCHETSNRRVCIVSPEDKVIKSYGEDDVINPTAITIDEEGYAFVVEYNSTNSRLLVFDPENDYKLLKSVTGFDYSEGVLISDDGTVYVGDHNNKCVRKCVVQVKVEGPQENAQSGVEPERTTS